MNGWFAAWWRQIVGPPPSDPWQDDPRIAAEREGQHDRINTATANLMRGDIKDRVDLASAEVEARKRAMRLSGRDAQ